MRQFLRARSCFDDGSGKERTILSGVHAFYEAEELVGKTLLAIVNLPPRSMMGIDSCGMLLSAIHVGYVEQLGRYAMTYLF